MFSTDTHQALQKNKAVTGGGDQVWGLRNSFFKKVCRQRERSCEILEIAKHYMVQESS